MNGSRKLAAGPVAGGSTQQTLDPVADFGERRWQIVGDGDLPPFGRRGLDARRDLGPTGRGRRTDEAHGPVVAIGARRFDDRNAPHLGQALGKGFAKVG